MSNTQQGTGLDKKTVGRGFSLFFLVTFGCFITYYWSLLKQLLQDHMHLHIPF